MKDEGQEGQELKGFKELKGQDPGLESFCTEIKATDLRGAQYYIVLLVCTVIRLSVVWFKGSTIYPSGKYCHLKGSTQKPKRTEVSISDCQVMSEE